MNSKIIKLRFRLSLLALIKKYAVIISHMDSF